MTDDLAHRVSSSRNFRFLAEPALLLAGDAVAAEAYADSDPDAAMGKARRFSETLTKMVMRRAGMDPDDYRNHYSRTEALARAGKIPDHVRQLLDSIREAGNQAVHDYSGDRARALAAAQACFDLGAWWYKTETGREVGHTFTAPAPADAASLREMIKNVEGQIARLQEAFDFSMGEGASKASGTADLSVDDRRSSNTAAAGQGPPHSSGERSSLGRLVFTASVGQHYGRLSIAFGPGETLVVTEQDATVHRWSLRDSARLPGARVSLPQNGFMRLGTGTGVSVSAAMPSVAIARGNQIALIHFTEDGHRIVRTPLHGDEYLIWGAGQQFATYDHHRVAVRDYADGSITWEQQSSRPVAAAALSASGTTMAVATFASALWTVGSSNRLTVVNRDDLRPLELSFRNLPVMAGCRLGLSAHGDLVVCASFREIVVFRAATGEILQRQGLDARSKEAAPGFGTRPQRLICLPDAQVIWLRDRHVVEVDWHARKFRYLPQEGLCDDIAFDHANSLLAMVNNAGKVDVYEWPGK